MKISTIIAIWVAAAVLGYAGPAGAKPFFEQNYVYVAGQDNVHTYRIPAITVSIKGTVLVFCEARKQSSRDQSPTDLVLKRSFDNGRVWEPIQTLVAGKGRDAIMNPCVLIDRSDGTIFLICINVHSKKRVLLLKSTDDGGTWSEPEDITSQINVEKFVSGPGVAIQLRSGRFVVPGYCGTYDRKTRKGLYSMVVYSDDHGRIWHAGAKVNDYTNESQVVELTDGRLMLNMRSNREQSCRAVAISEDGGGNFSPVYDDRNLNECPCQASFIRYSPAGKDGKNRLLFSNPDIAGPRHGAAKREKMTIRVSYDEGKSWPVSKLIHSGPSAYSGLAIAGDGSILCVYEGGEIHPREWVRLARFNIEWLTDGQDSFVESGGKQTKSSFDEN